MKQFTIISLLVGSGSPNKYSYEIGGSANDRRSYINTYQGRRNSQGKIIPINYHFASLIFGIIF